MRLEVSSLRDFFAVKDFAHVNIRRNKSSSAKTKEISKAKDQLSILQEQLMHSYAVYFDDKLTSFNLAVIPRLTQLGHDEKLMPALDLVQAPLLEQVNADWMGA